MHCVVLRIPAQNRNVTVVLVAKMNSNCRHPRKKEIRSLAELVDLRRSRANIPNHKEIVAKEKVAPVNENGSSTQSYRVLWARPSARKKRVWEGDGLLKIEKKTAFLVNDEGKLVSSAPAPQPHLLVSGSIFVLGSKQIEIVESCENPVDQTAEKKPTVESLFNLYRTKKIKLKDTVCENSASNFIKPYEQSPTVPLILPSPPSEHQWKFNPDKKSMVSVKVDNFLTLHLRPHQREGLVFLYECVMGFKHPSHLGAILADEMGLGKTLQCISLIWTLLKHGPYGICIARTVLVIAPTTLCLMWHKEFLKWLGRERILPYLIDNSNKPSGFLKNKHSVMIISYERLIKHITEIELLRFDLIVCDEAHRLKNSNVKITQALQKLCCLKRILLTGTPIQNDLREFFVLSNIANPGIFGTYTKFKELYEDPILRSQSPDCSNEVRFIGEECASKLNFFSSRFLLRRTQNVLENILPIKTEYVLCCELTQMQKEIYAAVLDKWWNDRDFLNIPPLSVIVLLKKICNHLSLYNEANNSTHSKIEDNNFDYKNLNLKNTSILSNNFQFSNKIFILKTILKNAVIQNNEKIVVVSCSTQMLDIIASECSLLNIISSRLDGNTPIPQRQRIVDSFNSHAHSESTYSKASYVLLLSSRAGGVGLSLPAASRLVLYDSDWNPAIDNQAMARIWRDGQRKPVHIYRFLTTGTIEEKIYQRQMFKTGLSDAILDTKLKKTLKICDTELKDLFSMSFDSESTTHDMLQCSCLGNGEKHQNEYEKEERSEIILFNIENNNFKSINQLKHWEHFRQPYSDEFLKQTGLLGASTQMSFIFRKISKQNNE